MPSSDPEVNLKRDCCVWLETNTCCQQWLVEKRTQVVHVQSAFYYANAAVARYDLRAVDVRKLKLVAKLSTVTTTIICFYFNRFGPALWVTNTISALDETVGDHC